ncbi:MAG: hypothetical protein RJB08_579, partial [Actinomycetota bacterium]
ADVAKSIDGFANIRAIQTYNQ